MIYIQFAALIPFYDNYGQNSTCVLLQDGSREYFNCSIKAYIHRMLYELHLDPRAVNFWTSKILGTKLNTPLIIDDSLVLIPIKFRKSVGKQDGCFGYVNNECIEKLDDTRITLAGGEVLPSLSQKSYILKKQKDAALLSYAYTDYKKQYEFMWKS
ncbi:MAG: hypothetical protein K0S71_1873 [Clostridia bacterium]|jgi:hypothetical protein|nr:hypothetical protein [Clostridia bacterium]